MGTRLASINTCNTNSLIVTVPLCVKQQSADCSQADSLNSLLLFLLLEIVDYNCEGMKVREFTQAGVVH